MENAAIASCGEKLANLCIGLNGPDKIPQVVLKERNPGWWILSLTTVYLSFAKHWLTFLPVKEVWMEVGRQMDDCFFNFVDRTRFELKASDVILHPSEQTKYCEWAGVSLATFHEEISDSYSLLSLVFADRCNQYTTDLRSGIIRQLSGKTNMLGPSIFAFKRFSQHISGIECDMQTIELPNEPRDILPFSIAFFDACVLTQQYTVEWGGRSAFFSVEARERS